MLIIAEISANHDGSLEKALQLVDAAADAGANAVKFQTYTADTMTIDHDSGDFVINDPKSLWNGSKLYDLYKRGSTPWEWHAPLFARAQQRGLLSFSSPFDESAVDFLESLDVPCYKVASFEIVDLPLIRYIARTKKPIIISTGLATLEEIEDAVNAAAGCEVTLLKCSSTYPASAGDCNLKTIADLKERFQTKVGLSDHTLGIGVACASVALGAEVIEKHLTLRRSDGGVDAAFSLEPAEFRQMVDEIHRAKQALGSVSYARSSKEQESLQFRRSLYIVEDISAGEVLTAKHIRRIRPGFGAPPKHLGEMIGKKVKQSMQRGERLCPKHIEK